MSSLLSHCFCCCCHCHVHLALWGAWGCWTKGEHADGSSSIAWNAAAVVGEHKGTVPRTGVVGCLASPGTLCVTTETVSP